MAQTYFVRDWDGHFENAQSRKCGRLTWVPMPNKHDGKSFRRLIQRQDGPALYGAWALILQVASKCPTRGVLADSDGPLDADDIAAKTGCPTELIETALEVLSSDRIAWIGKEGTEEIGSEVGACSQSTTSPLPEHSTVSSQNRTEGKGTEGSKKKNRTLSPSSPRDEADCDDDVAELIYQEYPRKVGKQRALKAIRAALEKETAQELRAAVREYAEAVIDQQAQFIPHPSTWFADERWLDDRTCWTAHRGGLPDASPTSGLEAFLAEGDEDDDILEAEFSLHEPPRLTELAGPSQDPVGL